MTRFVGNRVVEVYRRYPMAPVAAGNGDPMAVFAAASEQTAQEIQLHKSTDQDFGSKCGCSNRHPGSSR